MRFGVILAIGLSASLAHADLAQDKAKRRLDAEKLAKDAKQRGDEAAYVKCGQAYFDLYNLDPNASDIDEILYNAGVCFELGHSAGAAQQAYQLVEKYAPMSKVRTKAIARLARLFDTIAMFSEAADKFEQYAKAYAGEKDAKTALSEAVAIRRALRDDEKVIADARLFIRNYGAKDPKTSAEAMYAMTDVYRRKGAPDLEKHLREFLRLYAGADPTIRARATLELAESMWKRSCAVPGVDGLCLKVERGRVLPVAVKGKSTPTATRCGSASATTIAVASRDPKMVAQASTFLKEAIKLAMSSPSPDMTSFEARASLLLADQQLEAAVAVRFPSDLDFSPERQRTKEASLKKFNDFVQTRTRLGASAQQAYQRILALKDPSMAIAATQRMGMLPQAFAIELETGEIPKDVRTGPYAKDKVEAFCDKLTETAEPLVKQAITAFDGCLAKASQLGIRNESTRACARERAALGPTTFPLTAELLPDAPLALPVFDELPLLADPLLPKSLRDAVEYFSHVYSRLPIPDDQCLALARMFEGIAKGTRSADAWFMAGLTYGRCTREEPVKAKAAYEAALVFDPKHGRSISGLGELAIRAGNPDVAKLRWEAAVRINPKLFGAQLGLATLALREYRTLPVAGRRALVGDLELHARSAITVNPDSPLPYVQLGILAMLDGKPALARYLADRAASLASVPHTQLLYAALANGETETLARLETADRNIWRLPETKLALAIQQLALARYDDATKTLAGVAPSYEALIARGVAARGLGKVTDAEARYGEASKLEPARVEAHFNLGVLFKDHVAARATDPAAAKAAFKKAADAFRRANTPEATLWADDCDKAAALR